VALEAVWPSNRLVRVVRSTFHFLAIADVLGFNSVFISASADSISFSSNILRAFKVGGETTEKVCI
jgi:hypothetical protein